MALFVFHSPQDSRNSAVDWLRSEKTNLDRFVDRFEAAEGEQVHEYGRNLVATAIATSGLFKPSRRAFLRWRNSADPQESLVVLAEGRGANSAANFLTLVKAHSTANGREPRVFFGCFDALAPGSTHNLDTKVTPIEVPAGYTVKHAMSMDELRPQLALQRFQSSQQVQEVWFRGGHEDVTGDYPRRFQVARGDDRRADFALAWMLVEATRHGIPLGVEMNEQDVQPELRVGLELRTMSPITRYRTQTETTAPPISREYQLAINLFSDCHWSVFHTPTEDTPVPPTKPCLLRQLPIDGSRDALKAQRDAKVNSEATRRFMDTSLQQADLTDLLRLVGSCDVESDFTDVISTWDEIEELIDSHDWWKTRPELCRTVRDIFCNKTLYLENQPPTHLKHRILSGDPFLVGPPGLPSHTINENLTDVERYDDLLAHLRKNPGVVCVAGERGSGRSRLLNALEHNVRRAG